MNRNAIYSRTAKGERSEAAESRELASDLHGILHAIDGKSSFDGLRSRLEHLSAARLEEGLAALAAEGYIHEPAASPPGGGLPAENDGIDQSHPQSDESLRKAQELRAKIKGRREGGAERRAVPDGRRDASERRSAGQAGEQQSQRPTRWDAEQQSLADAALHARQEAEAKARRIADEQARRGVAEEEARLKALERARHEAEAQARRMAEELARRAAEEDIRLRVAERARQEAEDQSRRMAEELARRDAEEDARREAGERARQEAEEQARRMAEELARRDAEEQTRRETEQRVRQEAAEQARRDAEQDSAGEEAERIRARAAAQERLLAEEQAWLEAEEKMRREEEAAASKLANAAAAGPDGRARSQPRNWGKVLALAVLALSVFGLVAIHLISFDAQIPKFEKSAAAQFQQPVKIKALRFALLPLPHLTLEIVSIGNEGQIRVPRIKAAGAIGNLFHDKIAFKSLELESPVMTEEGLGWILFGQSPLRDLAFGDVTVLNASLDSKNVSLPAFDAKLQSDGEGGWKTIAVESADKNLSMELTSTGKAVKLDVKARSFKVPFGAALTLEDFAATGTADGAGLALTEFKGFAYGGTLSGNARLTWGSSWTLAGQLNAKQIDTAQLVPELLSGGRLAGASSYAMQAPEGTKLFASPHFEGSFAIPWGTLLGVDLGRMLQGGERRGETKFTELGGSFVHDAGVTQLRQVRLSQATMSATGNVDIDAQRNVRGRFVADLKLSTEQRRANLGVSGTFSKLEWVRQ